MEQKKAGNTGRDVEVLYEDSDLCVCRKPAGLPCESARASQKDIVKVLKKRYFFQNPDGGEPELFLVHRLDQPVGGLMVLARNKQAASQLGQQLTEHMFEKEYLAVVTLEQEPQAAEGRFEDYLCRDGKNNRSYVVSAQEKQAKKAVLTYQMLAKKAAESGYEALVKVTLQTGRHHQIRVQMAAHGMPLKFDRKYHPSYSGREDGDTALHAYHLVFFHPSDGRRMEFTDIPDREPFGEWRAYIGNER